MYAFVDESGNTGNDVFNLEQPDFYLGALITKDDFDAQHAASVLAIARQVSAGELHGSQLKFSGVERIARDLSELLSSVEHALYFGRVVKRDLAALKFFDVIFDPNDNPAASGLAYYASPLRAVLASYFNGLLGESSLRSFWAAVTTNREQDAHENLRHACAKVLQELDRIDQVRPRELISGALVWAVNNSEELTFYARDKNLRAQHLPNLAILPSLLHRLQQQSDIWNVEVVEIRHDEQKQFGQAIKDVHRMMSQEAKDETFHIGTEAIRFHAAPGSRLVMPTSSASPGIQIIDVLLWLMKRQEENVSYGEWTQRLIDLINQAYYFELSIFEHERRALKDLLEMDKEPISEEQLMKSQELIRLEEARRQQALANLGKNSTEKF